MEMSNHDQQRFEAALRFLTTKFDLDNVGDRWFPTVGDAIKMADELIAKLEETRKKSDD